MRGKELRQIRSRFGMTQEAFGEIIGVTKGYVGQLEREFKPITVTMEKLVRLLEKERRRKARRAR